MTNQYRGGCLCGEVSFAIDGDFDTFYLCHCEYCRKDTGSAHGANLFSSTAKLLWQSGEDAITVFYLAGTRHCKSFCSICGSALPISLMDSKLVMAPAGSLDCEVPIRPNAHIFHASKANWDDELQAIPKVEAFPARQK